MENNFHISSLPARTMSGQCLLGTRCLNGAVIIFGPGPNVYISVSTGQTQAQSNQLAIAKRLKVQGL